MRRKKETVGLPGITTTGVHILSSVRSLGDVLWQPLTMHCPTSYQTDGYYHRMILFIAGQISQCYHADHAANDPVRVGV